MKIKESPIEAINVLIKPGMAKSYEYKPHTIIALRYKQKKKPQQLLTESGEKLNRYWIRGILFDTPETRKALEEAQELSRQIAELQLKISSVMSVSSRVDMEELHKRIIDSNIQRSNQKAKTEGD